MTSRDEKRRELALRMAVEVASHQQVGKYNGDTVVNVADIFEKYLKSGKPEKA